MVKNDTRSKSLPIELWELRKWRHERRLKFIQLNYAIRHRRKESVRIRL